jgi:hypothetical protein
MMLTEETEVLAKKKLHCSTTVSNTHPTHSLGMNPDVRGEGLATDRLSHGTAVTIC